MPLFYLVVFDKKIAFPPCSGNKVGTVTVQALYARILPGFAPVLTGCQQYVLPAGVDSFHNYSM